MTTDLPFLPLPIAHDPLLLLWFGEQLPWLLAEVPSLARRRHAVVASELAPSFDAPPRPEPGTDAAIELKEASYMLLDEAARCGMPRAPSALARAAKARSRSLHLGIRWQWSAFQVLLYGGESYHRMLRSLSICVQTLHLESAAITVQRGYRSRIARKLLRAMRETIAREREAKAARELESCVRVQAIWRGFFLRTALRDVVEAEFADEMAELVLDSQGGGGGSVARGGAILSSASASSRAGGRGGRARYSASAQTIRTAHAARREKFRVREEQKAAAGVLQRRARVMGARAEIARNRALRENKDSRTKKLLDESGGSLTRLRVLVQRQRVLRNVLIMLYREVTMADHLPIASRPGGLEASASLTEWSVMARSAGAASMRGVRDSGGQDAAKDGARDGAKDGGQDGAKDGGDDGAVASSSAPSPSPHPIPSATPSPPTFPLHAASVAALGEGSALHAARKVAEALAAVELRQRALSTRVANTAARILAEEVSDGTRGAVQSAHSTEWSELVWRATEQARAAKGAALQMGIHDYSDDGILSVGDGGGGSGGSGAGGRQRRGRWQGRRSVAAWSAASADISVGEGEGRLCGGGVVARCLLS